MASATALSAKPTILNPGKPLSATSTSTSTKKLSNPIVRHGASQAYVDIENEEATVFRQTFKTPLSQIGVAQAHATGKHISVYKPSLLISSQLVRGRETANIVAQYSPLFVNTDPLLNEIVRSVDGTDIYGQENLSYKKWRGEMIKDYRWKDRFSPTDQSFFEFKNQTAEFLKGSLKDFEEQTVVLVGHSQSFATMISIAENGPNIKPQDFFKTFNQSFMAHGAITKLTHDPHKGWKVVYFNQTSHLL